VPTLTIIAGPNGAGKSTITRLADFEGRDRLLDPDAIARGMNPLNPPAAALPAGRETLRRTGEYLEQRVSFAVETTLAGHGKLDLLHEAKSRGYEVHLMFVGLDTPERCLSRIQNRVANGGHFVPDADVKRRFARSVVNATQALRLVDIAKFYDNSGGGHRLVLIAKAGVVMWQEEPLPGWLAL
jgi:predicted ABC-type ATPase